MSDDALYQCQVGGSMQVEPIVSNPVRLTVYVETTLPQILQGEEVERDGIFFFLFLKDIFIIS